MPDQRDLDRWSENAANNLPPVAPVSEAEVRERLWGVACSGYQSDNVRRDARIAWRLFRAEGKVPSKGMLRFCGLRYVSGKYYDLQEQG